MTLLIAALERLRDRLAFARSALEQGHTTDAAEHLEEAAKDFGGVVQQLRDEKDAA